MTTAYAEHHQDLSHSHVLASPASTKLALWTGRAMTGITALFLTFDAAVKVLQMPVAVQGTQQLGYPVGIVFWLGVFQVIALALYLTPKVSLFGAVLWTGYLGGAVATHIRMGNPLFTHTLSPIYVAVFLWAGLWLRDARLRAALR